MDEAELERMRRDLVARKAFLEGLKNRYLRRFIRVSIMLLVMAVVLLQVAQLGIDDAEEHLDDEPLMGAPPTEDPDAEMYEQRLETFRALRFAAIATAVVGVVLFAEYERRVREEGRKLGELQRKLDRLDELIVESKNGNGKGPMGEIERALDEIEEELLGLIHPYQKV